MDPRYEDEKVVLLDLKSIVEVDPRTGTWTNPSHSLNFAKIWREREGDQRRTFLIQNNSTM
jgi:hypothetical protein